MIEIHTPAVPLASEPSGGSIANPDAPNIAVAANAGDFIEIVPNAPAAPARPEPGPRTGNVTVNHTFNVTTGADVDPTRLAEELKRLSEDGGRAALFDGAGA